MSLVRKGGLIQLWQRLCMQILNSGSYVATPYNSYIELIGIRMEISSINDCFSLNKYILEHTKEEIFKFMFDLWHDKNQTFSFGESYAKRLSDYEGINQIQQTIALLTLNPYSRSATVILNNPCRDDPLKIASPPCVSLLQFLLRNQKLEMLVYLRSSDVGKKFCIDILFLSRIQKYVASKIDKDSGRIVVFIASAHIYIEDIEKIKNSLPKSKINIKKGDSYGNFG